MPGFREIWRFPALGGRYDAVQNNKVIDLGPTEDDGAGGESHGTVDDLPVGTELMRGQYTIASYLNSGGFGITYCAHDSLGRTVVIKECFPAIMCRRDGTKIAPLKPAYVVELSRLIEQFVSEAHALAALRHKNILHVHQVFEENDTAYMAIDFIDGPDLLDVIENTPERLTTEEVIRLTRRTLNAIKYVHDKNILHRDISPDNILIDEAGEPVLIDFGSARRAQNVPGRVFSKVKFVKDGYSPQEFYIEGAEQGPWSDLYSFAATLYHAISGAAPVDAQHRMSAVAQDKPDPYVPLAGRFGEYPEGFLEAIDHALAIMPADRIQTADEWLGQVPTRPARVLTPLSDEPERRTRPTRSPDEAESAMAAETAAKLKDQLPKTPDPDRDAPPEEEAEAPISLARDDFGGEFETDEDEDFEVDLTEFIGEEDETGTVEDVPSGSARGFVPIEADDARSTTGKTSEPGTTAETPAGGEDRASENERQEESADPGDEPLDPLENAIAETNRSEAKKPPEDDDALDVAIARTLGDGSTDASDKAPPEAEPVLPTDDAVEAATIKPEHDLDAPRRSRKGLFLSGVGAAAVLAGVLAWPYLGAPEADLVVDDTAPASGLASNPQSLTAPASAEEAAAPEASVDAAPAQTAAAAAPLSVPTVPSRGVDPVETTSAPAVFTDVTLPPSTADRQAGPTVPGAEGGAPERLDAGTEGTSLVDAGTAEAVPPALQPTPRPEIGPAVVAEAGFALADYGITDEAPNLSVTAPGIRLAVMQRPGDIADEQLPAVDAAPPAPLPPEPPAPIAPIQVTGSQWDVEMPFTSVPEQVRNAVTLRITEVNSPGVATRSGDWVKPDTILYAFNGRTLQPDTPLSAHVLADLTVDPDGFARATVRYRDATTGRIDRGLLAVPVVRHISLADGTTLAYRYDNGRWVITVETAGASVEDGLRSGDILLSERSTGIDIADEDGLRAVYERLVAANVGVARFVVERAGAQRVVAAPLARLEAP